MQAACSMNTNDYNKAIKDAMECRDAMDTSNLSAEAPTGDYMQYIYMTPGLTRIHFKNGPDLSEPAIRTATIMEG